MAPRTILIAQGDATSRESTARLIESVGYAPLQAASMAAVLEQLKEQRPEFILLGFDLQDTSGLEALTRIRQLDSGLPVVMLAPDLWDTRVAEAMRLGAVAYLARPFGQDDLRELLVRR